MKILMVSPQSPDTFWSFKYALKFVRKKSAFPPLGLLTVASLLPKDWEIKLVDMNTSRLKDKYILWADYVFIGAMHIQMDSANIVIDKCLKLGRKTVVGGPLFTMNPELFTDRVDHFVLNEAELTLPEFIKDLNDGTLKKTYTNEAFADIRTTPIPRWDLVDLDKYASISIQYSRGCPFECDFCNVTALFGRIMRNKTPKMIIDELNNIYDKGYRGAIFFVDDNFIGQIKALKNDLLPELKKWRESHKGLTFFTEVSINIADDSELLKMMEQSGFNQVFIGIETPNNDSHTESNKKQNKNRDLIGDIKKIQRAGIQVQAGFILGFDADTEDIFKRQIDFIQESGITTAMIGLLQAVPGTKLYTRMKNADRLINATTSGDNASGNTNIYPTCMDLATLENGYRHVVSHLYKPKNYYKRVKIFLRSYKNSTVKEHMTFNKFRAFFKSMYVLGIIGRERYYYWNLLLWTLLKRPSSFSLAVNLSILGFHFRRVSAKNKI